MNTRANNIYLISFLVIIFSFGLFADQALLRNRLTGAPDLSGWSADVGNGFENDYIAAMPLKYEALDLNGAFRRLFGQREMNGIVRMDNGYLTASMESMEPQVIAERAQKVAQLRDELEARGIAFLFVEPPFKVDPEDPQMPAGETDFTNRNIDMFLAELAAQNVPAMDLRAQIRADGLDYYSLFYGSDHHWTVPAGFYGARQIMDWLEQATGKEIPDAVQDPASYRSEYYEDQFVGTWALRTGEIFGGRDDFEILLPEFETRLKETAEGREGTFTEILMHTKPLEEKTPKPLTAYAEVLDDASLSTTNLLAENDMKVMFISDSFGLATGPYLALGVQDLIWVSSYDPAGVAAAVEAVQPDAVVLMQYAQLNLIEEKSYNFGY